ncbi:hypothetical protein [Methylobrevis albus]|uniref:Uncharacterized protein n=1 Tax=Methylobrevis albus TaxID=2793297 RepID=A0A931I4J4_9HYPH|nr:hypothetical protein [Methylobrevis albus]MBH0238746.1 hypothetical protein [Methylobrevis albus]
MERIRFLEADMNAEWNLNEGDHFFEKSVSKLKIFLSALFWFSACYFILSFGASAALLNDGINSAIAIKSNLKYIAGTTVGATVEAGEPDFENGEIAYNSVWYKYRATNDGYLVILSFAAINIGLDVFDGPSFDPRHRLVSGFRENIPGFPSSVIRLLTPTVVGEVLYIRVANPGNTSQHQFGIYFQQTGQDGEILVIPFRSAWAPMPPSMISGESAGPIFANFQPNFIYINTMRSAGNITDAGFDMPTANVRLSGARLQGRSSTKPGVQFGSLLWDNSARRNEIGTWNYTFLTKIRVGSASYRFGFRIPLSRWRDRQVQLALSSETERVNALLGQTARLVVSVNNPSGVLAKNCQLLHFRSPSGYVRPYEVRWRRLLPLGVMNAPIDIPARSTRQIEIFINTNFIGEARRHTPFFECENSSHSHQIFPQITIYSRP